MSTTTPTTASISASELERQLVVFSMHGEHYALAITSVREIIRYTTPKATGAANGLIQGMIVLRGHVLPVVDLSSTIGQTLEINNATRILVVEVAAGAVGLIVDTVEEVLLVPADQIEPIPVTDGALGDQLAKVEDRLITLVDPERALGDALAG
jgi:purine-binding chemotaxis protein CheW